MQTVFPATVRPEPADYSAFAPDTAVAEKGGRTPGDLRLSEERFRLLIESVPDYAIFMLDTGGCVATWNTGAERIKLYTEAEIVGRHFSVFYPPEEIARGKPEAELITASGEGRFEEEGWRVRKDGSRFWASVVISAIRDEAGGLCGFAKVVRDITERRKEADAQSCRVEATARGETRRESEERMQAVIENLSEGLVISDLDGNLLHWNPAAMEMHGFMEHRDYRQRLAAFAEVYELTTLDGTVVPFTEWPMGKILRGETVRNLELRLRRLDNDWERVFNYNGSIIHDASARPLAFLSITDITRRKQAEREFHQLNTGLEQRVARRTTELEAANRELESFSYSVSHDLRAPLRAIDGYSLILLEDHAAQLDAEGRRVLDVVRSEARRMGQLVDELMTFSRLGRQALHRSAVDMTGLARAVFEEASRTMVEPRREVRFHLAELPPAQGDPTLLRQVWTNLISNALKFTRNKETANVRIDCIREGTGNVYSVSDDGAGFNMRYAKKLFGVFQRLHNEEEFEGTGVGLAIAQRIVERHGGRIWAEGETDKGATFFFALPCCERNEGHG